MMCILKTPPPVCRECRLTVSEEVSHRKAACVLRGMEGAMREYNGRLSSENVRTILTSSPQEQLDKLINMMQVSDLTALSNVLDEEVVRFLLRFVRDG